MKTQKVGLVALAVASFFVSACNSGKSGANAIVYENTVDNYVPWLNEQPSNVVSIGNAHSGVYAFKINANSQYSAIFNQPLQQITKAKIKKVLYTAYVIRENNTVDCKLVVDIRDKNDKLLKWEGKDTKEVQGLKDKEWTKISLELDLTKDNLNDPENRIKIYTLNMAKADVLVDDMTIAFEVE